MASAAGPQSVAFYFDPVCQWAWRASLWIREVEKVRPIEVHWKFLSLHAVNIAAGNEPRPRHQAALNPFRVMTLARRTEGDAAVGRLYLALGRAWHEDKVDFLAPGALGDAMDAAGYDPGLLDAALADPTTEEEWKAEEAEMMAAKAVGVPTLVVGDAAPLFGPVIGSVPTGEEAGELWDHTIWFTRKPYFYEIKRSR
jgi:2-hydroxychromene-2-carboxylate isomerase